MCFTVERFLVAVGASPLFYIHENQSSDLHQKNGQKYTA